MLKVGGEVDALCNKCELVLAHTIHAMVGPRPVKVECNTCHAVHAYRAVAGAAPRKRPASPARERKGTVISFEEQLRAKNLAAAVRYDPKVTFALDQVIEHPVFGLGFVSDVKDASKIAVTFRSDVKILVHGRG